jgi:hypothetical protein
MTVDQLGRAVQAYRRTARSRSAILLLLANAIPIVGVLFFGWSLFTILVLYWLENGIVGFWNVPKIVLAQGSIIPALPDMPGSAALAATGDPARAAELQAGWQAAQAARRVEIERAQADAAARLRQGTILGPNAAARLAAIPRTGLAIFFLVHYGMFWFVHGVFVFALPTFIGGEGPRTLAGCGDADPFGGLQPCAGPFGGLSWSAVVIAGGALFLSHGASFLFNYIGRGEYLTASPTRQMGAPYGRVIVLHVTILLGSMAVALLDSPIVALLVLVVLKTAFDLSLHLREHRSSGPPLPPGTAGPAAPAA